MCLPQVPCDEDIVLSAVRDETAASRRVVVPSSTFSMDVAHLLPFSADAPAGETNAAAAAAAAAAAIGPVTAATAAAPQGDLEDEGAMRVGTAAACTEGAVAMETEVTVVSAAEAAVLGGLSGRSVSARGDAAGHKRAKTGEGSGPAEHNGSS